MEPESYYAAGILSWFHEQQGKQFYVGYLRHWRRTEYQGGPFLKDDALFAKAVRILVDEEILEFIDDPYGPHMIAFAMDFPLEYMAEKYPISVYAKTSRFGRGWIETALEKVNERQAQQIEQISISDAETWEPLPLQSSPEATEILAEAEATVREIQSDNGFATEFPRERDSLVAHAEATIAAARSGVVTKKQVKESLIGAGKWLLEKFGSTSIGTLGGELVKIGLRLLGLIS